MMNPFTEEYYKSKNYVNYLSKKDRYAKTASEISDVFNKIEIINHESKILDYGCSLGFLIKGFEKLGYNQIVGYDISEWATSKAKLEGCKILDTLEGNFDLVIFLDVLEHMTDAQIIDLFQKIKAKRLLVRIPCSSEEEPNEFYLEISRLDPTHINCKPASKWVDFFNHLGYNHIFKLNMSTIYNSNGCFCALIM